MATEYAPLPRSSLELESAVHDSNVKPASHSTLWSWKTYALALSLLADILLTVLCGHFVAIWEEKPESRSQSPFLHQGNKSDKFSWTEQATHKGHTFPMVVCLQLS